VKRRIVGLTFCLLLSSSLSAQLAPGSDVFMGVAYGKPIAASMNECGPGNRPVPCFKPFVGKPSAFVFRDGAGTIIVNEDEAGAVYKSDLLIAAGEVAAYRKALAEKFGKAANEAHTPVQNAYGAQFTIDEYVFDTGQLVVRLQSPDEVGGDAVLEVETKTRWSADHDVKSAQVEGIGKDF
jgi:hypothetical protein